MVDYYLFTWNETNECLWQVKTPFLILIWYVCNSQPPSKVVYNISNQVYIVWVFWQFIFMIINYAFKYY
jgi:hypothetical protein